MKAPKTCVIIFVAMASAVLTGCSNSEKQALDSFKPIVAYLSGLTNSEGAHEFADFSFNVIKTDSLVSPFTGVIAFKEHKKTEDSSYRWDFTFTCHFALQDGKWVHKSIEGDYLSIRDPDPNFSDAINEEVRAKLINQRLQSSQLYISVIKMSLDAKLSKFLNCPPINESNYFL